MAGVFEPITQQFSGSDVMSNMILWGAIGLIIVLLTVFFAIIAYVVIIFVKYKYRIEIYENIAGRGYFRTRVDRAMLMKVGDGGEEILYLRKHRLYRQAYGKLVGKRTYAFAIGPDGYWYNFVHGDLDVKLGELGVEPVDRDMRYMNIAIRRNIKDRYAAKSFLQQYGGLLAYAFLILITGVMAYLLFNQYLEISRAISQAVATAADVMKETKELVGALDSLKGSGSITAA